MLIITRQIGEWLLLGDTIRVQIVDVNSRGQVKIGVEAPPEVPITRPDAAHQTPKGPVGPLA